MVESDEHIKVGFAGVDHGALKKQIGSDKVEKTGRVWPYIMRLVNHMPILN